MDPDKEAFFRGTSYLVASAVKAAHDAGQTDGMAQHYGKNPITFTKRGTELFVSIGGERTKFKFVLKPEWAKIVTPQETKEFETEIPWDNPAELVGGAPPSSSEITN